MREVLMLRGAEPKRVLQSIVEKRLPATMCYLSRGKWHIAKIQALGVDSRELVVDILPPGYSNRRESNNSNYKPRPINIKLGQPVGVSVKCEGGKFIFETKVFIPSPKLCTDNAAVIAATAFYQNQPIDWRDLKPDPSLHF